LKIRLLTSLPVILIISLTEKWKREKFISITGREVREPDFKLGPAWRL